MVLKKEKERTMDFLLSRVLDSGMYDVLDSDIGLLFQDKRTKEVINLFVANFFDHPNVFYPWLIKENKSKQIYNVPILYKDGKTASVGLDLEKKDAKTRQRKSLSEYSIEEIERMLYLRDIEKKVKEAYGGRKLFYFDSEHDLADQLVEVNFCDVNLDYSYLNEDNPAYGKARNHVSLDFMLPDLFGKLIEPAICFSRLNQTYSAPRTARSLTSNARRCQEELWKQASKTYPKLDLQEAYNLMYGERILYD